MIVTYFYVDKKQICDAFPSFNGQISSVGGSICLGPEYHSDRLNYSPALKHCQLCYLCAAFTSEFQRIVRLHCTLQGKSRWINPISVKIGLESNISAGLLIKLPCSVSSNRMDRSILKSFRIAQKPRYKALSNAMYPSNSGQDHIFRRLVRL